MTTTRSATLLAIALGLASCGGDDDPAAPDAAGDEPVDVPEYRPPVLTAVQPPSVSVGSAAFVLEADGTFDADAVVLLDGVALTTRVISATTLEADVPAELVTTPQLRFVQVLHTDDGGGVSGSRSLAVVEGVAPPVLDELVPASVLVGTAAAPIQVDGWNFRPTSVVTWDGEARPTTFVSSARLTAAIPATDLDEVGSADVAVLTPDAAPAAAPLVFTIDPLPINTIGVEGLASVTTTDTAGSAINTAELSLDGRYVTFASTSASLVASDGNAVSDVFLRDTCRGAGGGCVPSTIRISVDATGGDAADSSSEPAISGTGRYVVFASNADDIVAGTSMGMFVRDTCIGASGCTPSTVLASLLPEDGSVLTYNGLFRPAISRDGRFVAFEGSALGSTHVFLTDTCRGALVACTPKTEFLSRTLDAATTCTSARFPALSAAGRYLAFQCGNASLDGQPVTAGLRHVYVLDTCHGAGGCARSFVRASVSSAGGEVPFSFPQDIAISDDGRHVGFSSYGATWTAETNIDDNDQTIVRDTCIGASGCTPSTTVVSAVGGAASNGDSSGPRFSSDGRFVAFMSLSSNLVINDTNAKADIFVRDRCLGAGGCVPSIRRVSVSAAGVQANNHSGTDGSSSYREAPPAMTGDGSLVAFLSMATNLGPVDANVLLDAYLAGTGYPE